MISFMLYMRRVFCRHIWKVEESQVVVEDKGKVVERTTVVYMRCDLCGYHQRHKKFKK